MRNGDERRVAVDPLTKEQRQRLECMTAVRALWFKSNGYSGVVEPISHTEAGVILELTEYLATGAA
jgi:hypothetical protein